MGILLKGDIKKGTHDDRDEFIRTECTEGMHVRERVYCSETSVNDCNERLNRNSLIESFC